MAKTVTARAHPNIAFIKYWGNIDDELRLPANPSISMNLDGLYAETTVTWQPDLQQDTLILNDEPQQGAALQRVSLHLDALRQRLGIEGYAAVSSKNNFPMGTGIASSAAAFAALTLAACAAAGKNLSERELSTLARLGSGSASRSIPGGFVQWHAGDTHEASYAESVAPATYWNIVDVVAVVSSKHKTVTSQHGHPTANTSDLQAARVAKADQRLQQVRQAILERDFTTFAEVVELDSNLMHAVMMTSRPPLFYWLPATLAIMEAVRQWRAEGIQVCYTLDAGPNVHCICTAEYAEEVRKRLDSFSEVEQTLMAKAGGPAHIISD